MAEGREYDKFLEYDGCFLSLVFGADVAFLAVWFS
jgi:hypothetical protein